MPKFATVYFDVQVRERDGSHESRDTFLCLSIKNIIGERIPNPSMD